MHVNTSNKTLWHALDFVPTRKEPALNSASAYAPANIALIKYWGKRNTVLNLPVTDSLSLSLAHHGTTTQIFQHDQHDVFHYNGQSISSQHPAFKRLFQFLDNFRPSANFFFEIRSDATVPMASGLASSASGFAALVLALQQFWAWPLDKQQLSTLARLGSGSASRSLWHGFVRWQAGKADDGRDSMAYPLDEQWRALRFGLLIHDTKKKHVSSRDAMMHTQRTCPLYASWPHVISRDMDQLLSAIRTKAFDDFGHILESNAQAMHALMMAARPSIRYSDPITWQHQQQVWDLRQQGIPVYFTQDAGANLKLLFTETYQSTILDVFPTMTVVTPFSERLPMIGK